MEVKLVVLENEDYKMIMMVVKSKASHGKGPVVASTASCDMTS